MSYFINRLQSGGSAPPFVGYLWTPTTQDGMPLTYETGSGRSSRSRSGDDDDDDSGNEIGLKDLLKLAQNIDALPNEVELITNTIRRLYSQGNIFNRGLIDLSSIVSTYLSILQQARVSKFNKNEYEKAYNTVTANNGLNEIAIDLHGYLRVIDKDGKILAITAEEFMQNTDKYSALTNADLLDARANSPSYAFRNDALSIVSNGIGYESVVKMIQQAMSKIGSTDLSRESYTARSGDSIQGGLVLLQQAQQTALAQMDENGQMTTTDLRDVMSVEGLYKNRLVTKDLAQQINKALKALWMNLPINAKTWLAVNSGNRENPYEGAFDLISEMMFASENRTSQFSTDFQSGLNIDGSKRSGTSGEGSGSKTKMSAALTWLEGHGDRQTIVILNGTSHGLPIQTFSAPITSKAGEALGETTLNNVATSSFAGILDFDNATMGDNLILSMDQCIVNSTALYSMELPIDQEAAAQGIIKPDFKFLPLIEQAEEEIRINNITDPAQINAIYRKYNLPLKYTDGRTLNTSIYQRFGVLNGYATNKAFSEDVSMADYIDEIDDENIISGKMRIINHGKEGKSAQQFDLASGWDRLGLFWDSHDSLYSGTIFIPVRNNYINAMVASGNLPQEGAIESYEEAIQRQELARQWNPQAAIE